MIRCIAVCVTVLSLTIAADAASSQASPSSAYALFGQSRSQTVAAYIMIVAGGALYAVNPGLGN
jgi:hypothetical protein